MKWSAILAIAAFSTTAGAVGAVFRDGSVAKASDHDDGENEVKARNLNLTDLYVFREDWQTGNAGDASNLILIMNTNPRSVARQQYYFSDRALYEFHVSRVGQDPTVENDTPGRDMTLRFEFDEADANNVQEFTLTVLEGGVPIGSDTGDTSPLTLTSPITTNGLTIAGQDIDVFAGLREDPFFFDVEQYFRVRGGLAGFGPAVGFRPVASAVDFAAGYNVNTIVVRVPIALLAGTSGADVFDVWETISIPAGVAVNQ
jgi:hypothetical protein